MNEKKRITLDFYGLTPDPIPEQDFNERKNAFNLALQNLPKSEALRPYSTGDGSIFSFGEFVQSNRCLFGTLVKCQTNDIPPKVNPTTRELNPLEISEKEGLGFSTCFLYDFLTGIVMIEKTVKGPTVHSLAKFLMNNLDIPRMHAELVINPADIAKVMEMNSITKFHVKVKKVENGTIFYDPDQRKSVAQLIRPADDTNTNLLEIKLSVSKKKESLSLGTIKEMIRGLLQYKETDEVEVLEIYGSEDEESHPQLVDLIKQRLSEYYFVERQRLIGSFTIKERFGAMDEKYAKHRPGLLKAYGIKQRE